MRVNSLQLIKLCCTRTDPATKTESIGLQADALVPRFLLFIETISSWHVTSLPSIWTGYRFAASPWPLASLPFTGTGKKRGTATQTAPNQTAGPLGCNKNFCVHLPACPDRFAALPGQLNITRLIRNVWQLRFIWTGRKQAHTSQAKFDWQKSFHPFQSLKMKNSVYPIYRDTQLPPSSFRSFRNILPVCGFRNQTNPTLR